MFVFDRHQIAAVAHKRVAFFSTDRLYIFGVTLREARVEIIDQRNIQTIHPDYRRVAQISVIVIRPRRRQDEVTGVHRRSFAFDGRICTIAFNDEAQRGRRVTVRRRNFSRKDKLKTRIQSVCDLRSILDPWICKNQYSAVGFLCRDQLSGFHKKWPHLFITPQSGNGAWPRLSRNDLSKSFPQWSGALALQPLVKFTEFVGCFRFVIKAGGIHQAARTFTSIVPIFSIVAAILSPGCMGLTPSGVPVTMTSPGLSV